MKFLEFRELELLAATLSTSSPSVYIKSRIEAYSCKSVSKERKWIKSLDQEMNTDLLETSTSVSPQEDTLLDSAFGRLDNKNCRKTFWLLIATLNAAYPDHNFTHLKPEDFHREESPREVLLKMSEALELESVVTSSLGALSVSPASHPTVAASSLHRQSLGPSDSLWAGVHPSIKQTLDPVIDLLQCEVYAYYPDLDSDPHAVDSDDEGDEADESVASSIFGRDHEDYLKREEATMWPMEGLEQLQLGLLSTPLHLAGSPPRKLAVEQAPDFVPPAPPPSLQLASEIPARTTRNKSRSALDTSVLDLSEDSAGGLLWSTHHFFYNRKIKRIVFISIWARAISSAATFKDCYNHDHYCGSPAPGMGRGSGNSLCGSACAPEESVTYNGSLPENKRRLSNLSAQPGRVSAPLGTAAEPSKFKKHDDLRIGVHQSSSATRPTNKSRRLLPHRH